MSSKYDFVVFGASGFTGKYVCKELVKQCSGQDMKIAFSGRSQKKLEGVLQWLRGSYPEVNADFIIADVEDDQSLLNMCKQSKAVLDCVGPFKLWGEPVVKACIEAGCDYLDITGEPEFMERIKRKYHEAATKKGVYIISACGFDCIPSELGIIFAKDKFPGTLATAENFFHQNAGEKGMTGNYGTYASLVNGFAGASELRSTRRSDGRKSIPICGPKLKFRGVHYKSNQSAYALPFPGADVSVVKNSQRFYFEHFKEVPVQFSMYFCRSFFSMVSIFLFMVVLKIFTSFSSGVKLMLSHPKIFTAGSFTYNGPTEEQMAGASFRFEMFCKGYKKKITAAELEASGGCKDPLDKEMKVLITGPEIGYVLTPIAIVQSALTLQRERDSLPSTGGIYTPGPVFRHTTIIQRLQRNGVNFEVVE